VTIPLAKDETPGQVVSFDTNRSRKGRKSEKHGKGSASQHAKASPSVKATMPPVIDPPIRVAAMALPHGTMAESELEPATGHRGKSVVLWLAVGVVALAVAYLVFPRGDSKPSVSAPQETSTPTVAASVPAVVSPPPVASALAESIPQIPETLPPAPEKPKPALGPVKPPVTKKPADRIPPTATTATASGSRKTAGQAQTQTPTAQVAPPPKIKPAPAEPAPTASVALAGVKTPSQDAPATSNPDANVTGVGTIPEPAPAAPKSTVVAGTLIPIDEADTLPVPLSHRPPIYSMAARQLRISGTVIMNVLVNDRGYVDQVVLVTGVPGGDVNEAAIRAAKSWIYRPATKDGVPVKVWKSEQIVFKL
jgi:protein TonB